MAAAEQTDAGVNPPTEIEEAEVLAEQGDYRSMEHSSSRALERVESRLPMELTADELVGRLDKLRDAAEKALTDGVDFGVIPGVDKPSLFKPGAEKLCLLFMLDPETDVEERYDRDGHLSVLARTTIYHAPTGVRLGTGVGSCTTRETRYAYRQAQRECPVCGQETVFKSRKNEGEWYCWAKKGGCGANFDAGSEHALALSTVDVGRKARPPEELADFYNTVLKMGAKRSLVAAVLVTTGASAIYTQDVEDSAPPVMEPVRRDPATDGFPVPTSWPKVKEAIISGYGAGEKVYAEFEVYLGQAAEHLYGEASLKNLQTEQRHLMLQKASGAAVWLRDNAGDELRGPSDEQMRQAWAAVLGGTLLVGPPVPVGTGDSDADAIPFGETP